MKKVRLASSLILATTGSLLRSASDEVHILALKRSQTTSHFPNAYVFPGGNCDEADGVSSWLNILSEAVGMQFNKNESKDCIPSALASRITAIRETFEECGILLCRGKTCPEGDGKTQHYDIEDSAKWRLKIRNDAYEFLNLCRTFECVPDVNNLYTVRNWVTPVHYPRRYDCTFFVAVLGNEADPKPDFMEIQDLKWQPIAYYLREYKDIFLPPPQFYEFSKLSKYPKIDDFLAYVQQNNQREPVKFMPVLVLTSDGMVGFLPGDAMYQEMLEKTNNKMLELPSALCDLRCNVMHRLEYKFDNDNESEENRKLILQNFSPENLRNTVHNKM